MKFLTKLEYILIGKIRILINLLHLINNPLRKIISCLILLKINYHIINCYLRMHTIL